MREHRPRSMAEVVLVRWPEEAVAGSRLAAERRRAVPGRRDDDPPLPRLLGGLGPPAR